MERNGRTLPDNDANWVSNNGMIRNGHDADGNPLNGTPKADNSSWAAASSVDLVVDKQGPTTAMAGATIAYQITIINNGSLTATAVTITDTLPTELTYLNDNSSLPLTVNPPHLLWQAGDLGAAQSVSFLLTAQIHVNAAGTISNELAASTTANETNLSNNQATAVTDITTGEQPQVLIDAVYYDGYETDDLDEAVALRNISQQSLNIGGWLLSDGGTGKEIPADTILAPGQVIWLARDAGAFGRQFGFAPDVDLITWPGFANDSGDEVILLDTEGTVIDVLVYKVDEPDQSGWSGPAVEPYKASTLSAKELIMYRRRDQTTGLPVPDTNTAVDWAPMTDDVINGRKMLYPGWNLDEFFFTHHTTETAKLTIAIAPDNAYETLVNAIDAANTSLQIETLTFENLAIAAALIRAQNRGVNVTVLLEGGPVGGIPDQEKYICQQLEAVGGQCWFMINDSDNNIHARYTYLHAKFVLIDGEHVAISSENLSPNSLPYDDKSDGTWGRRGVMLITDAPGVVNHVQTIFDQDFDPKPTPTTPDGHLDLYRWTITDTQYGPPPPGFIPITQTGGITYVVRYPQPTTLQGTFNFELVQSPENSLRDQDGLLGLIKQAGDGDTIFVQQLSERPHWGPSTSNPVSDPNPRLEAYINAARRGARVQLLLDKFFNDWDDPVSNSATCHYVNDIAKAEHLSLSCQLGDPAGLGIHSKMVLLEINGRGFIHIGSINGSELSSKGNRELALQIQSDAAYALLADMFLEDWPYRLYLPLIFNNYLGPASYPLISEVHYNPGGLDEAEFIELVNPTPDSWDLSNYSLGDAVNPTDFEDVRRFPPGTTIAPGNTLVIATSATAFYTKYNFNPDLELLETDTAVPSMIDDLNWGDPAAVFQLGNSGDEVILRDEIGQAVDVVTYGTGAFPGVTACLLVTITNASLERYPYWRDTNDCTFDFREWHIPNPGILP